MTPVKAALLATWDMFGPITVAAVLCAAVVLWPRVMGGLFLTALVCSGWYGYYCDRRVQR